MNKGFIVLILLAAVISGPVGVVAQASPAAGQTNGAAPTSAVPSSSPDATTLTVRGTIDNYDPLTRTLALSTHGGVVNFPVASTTRIRQGGQNVDQKALPQLSGKRATVRYTESGGNKIVESVHVFGK